MTRMGTLAAIAAAFFFVAGCGGDNGDSTTPTAKIGESDTNDAGGEADTGSSGGGVDTGSSGGATDTGGTKPNNCSCKGKQCGFIPGCSKSCGACAAGMSCQNHVCVPQPKAKLLPFGSYCGAGTDCPMPANNASNTKWQQYYDCLDGICETNRCSGGLCTLKCTILEDKKINHSGDNGADGIEDPNADSECIDAADGTQGKKFRCVELRSPAELSQGSSSFAMCRPGTNFKPCKANKDCPTGEMCRLLYVYGEYQTRCMPPVKHPDGKPGKPFSHACNRNPGAGPLSLCRSDICFGLGCIEFCSKDSDCVTGAEKCTNGTCPNGQACTEDAHCSAWKCDPGHRIYSNVDKEFSVCWPKECGVGNDCGKGYYCRLSYNGVQNIDGDPDPKDKTKKTLPGYANRCYRIADGSAKPGEKCDPYLTDKDQSYPPCGDPFRCENGRCGNLCKTDKDCPGKMLCGAREFGFDLSNPEDNIDDVHLPFSQCFTMPGANKDKPCYGQSECPKGKHCRAWHVPVNLSQGATPVSYKFVAQGLCIDEDKDKGNWGSHCGAQFGAKLCNGGQCFNTTSNSGAAQAGYCADVCSGRKDCAGKAKLYGYDYQALCRSSLWAFNTTLDPLDDLYRPVCRPTSKDASLEDCSKSFDCKALTDACRAYPIAWGPDKPIKVEYWCTRNFNGTGKPAPSKTAGEVCDLESNDYQCKGGYCMTDSTPGKGYCSRVCKSDSDCGKGGDGMFCDKGNMGFPGLARADAKMAGIVPVCRKKKSCIPCSWDHHCAGAYACTNIGGNGSLAKMRCAPPCKTDADCKGTDGGASCVPVKSRDGKARSLKVCQPGCVTKKP